jgi:hypothetical protein
LPDFVQSPVCGVFVSGNIHNAHALLEMIAEPA